MRVLAVAEEGTPPSAVTTAWVNAPVIADLGVGDGDQLVAAPLPSPDSARISAQKTYRATVTATIKSMIALRAAGLNPRIARN